MVSSCTEARDQTWDDRPIAPSSASCNTAMSITSDKHSLPTFFSQQYFGKCSQEWLSESFLSPFPTIQGDVQLCKDTLFCLGVITRRLEWKQLLGGILQEMERAAWSRVWSRTGLGDETELLRKRRAGLGWDAKEEMLCRLVTYRYSSGIP